MFEKLPSKHLNVAMDVIFDIFFNPIFPEEDVKREAEVICEEIKMYRDNPMRHTLEMVKKNLYDSPFGDFTAGEQEVVRKMTREQLKKKHDEIYVPKNSVLCVVGNNDFEEVVTMAQKLSSNIENNENTLEFPNIKLRNLQSEEERGDLQQSNVALGIHFPKASEKESYAAEVFSAILGHGMSSKLFTEVREKRGLVYGVKSDLDNGKNYGYMLIWAGTDPSKVGEVKEICMAQFSKMKSLTQEELERAKVQVVGNRRVESEGSSDTAVNLFMSEVSGDAREYYGYEKNINSVTLEEIKALADKVDFASFSLGPKS